MRAFSDFSDFDFTMDTNEIAALLEEAGRLDLGERITGAMSREEDAYIWVTESKRPYDGHFSRLINLAGLRYEHAQLVKAGEFEAARRVLQYLRGRALPFFPSRNRDDERAAVVLSRCGVAFTVRAGDYFCPDMP
jgi:hypothetical protein